MAKVLVTGSAGFIGSHLVERYLERGDEVLGIDNFMTGDSVNLQNARQNPSFTFVDADVSENHDRLIADLERSFGRADLILHFASPASPVDYAQLPIETMAVNSRGTEFCLKLAHRWGARVLYASTSESYGDPLQHPQRESYWGNVNPVGPRSCYDESKRFGEALVMSYIRVHDVDARIIRIFNTYGPRMRKNDGRVVPNFVSQALEGRPLTIYGDGSQTRSFCYVDDLVEGIMRCADASSTRGVVVNLGNPEEHTIREFAEIVCEIVGVPLRVEACPMPPDDPTRRNPDISRAIELLDWRPAISLKDGLARTVDSLRVSA
jgi:nucleoside-diphosphate-sugar epimerase